MFPDAQRHFLVVNTDRPQCGFDRASYVDWRLLRSDLASVEICFQIAPMLGSGRPFVTPMRRVGGRRLWRRAGRQAPQLDRTYYGASAGVDIAHLLD